MLLLSSKSAVANSRGDGMDPSAHLRPISPHLSNSSVHPGGGSGMFIYDFGPHGCHIIEVTMLELE